MTGTQADDAAARAARRDLVRRGYDTISDAYRSDDGQAAVSSAEDVSRYAGWAAELAALLPRRWPGPPGTLQMHPLAQAVAAATTCVYTVTGTSDQLQPSVSTEK